MDILTVVLACSLHFDDQLVLAIIQKNSEGMVAPSFVVEVGVQTTPEQAGTFCIGSAPA